MWRTNFAPAGLRGRVILGKGTIMNDLISKQVLDLWNRYRPTIAVDAIEYDRELKKLLSTNLASLGTDCISKQQAIDALRTCYDTETITMDNGDEYINYGDAVGEIEQLPPIQPKRGKWIEDKGQQTLMRNFIERGEVWRVCSICGAGHMIGHKYATDKAYHDRYHNFCPNCGADMRGEQYGRINQQKGGE